MPMQLSLGDDPPVVFMRFFGAFSSQQCVAAIKQMVAGARYSSTAGVLMDLREADSEPGAEELWHTLSWAADLGFLTGRKVAIVPSDRLSHCVARKAANKAVIAGADARVCPTYDEAIQWLAAEVEPTGPA